MNKKEIMEIKKQFTAANCNITRIAMCYVNHEKEIILSKTEAFLSLPEEEMFKYFDIFRKSLSGSKGKNLYDVDFPVVDGSSEQENFLNDLRKSKLDDDEILEEFYGRIIDSYDFGENYLILLIHGLYDIPGKTSDDLMMEDASEEVYEHIMCCICPVSLSKPGLSVNSEKGKVEDRIRDWVVEMPADAFLYPAFNDRSTDIHSMLYYSKKSPVLQQELVYELTGKEDALLSNEEECELVAGVLKEGTNITFDTIKSFSEEVMEILEEHEGNTEAVQVSPKQLAGMLEKAGLDAEESANVTNGCKTRLGEKKEIHLSSLVDKNKTTIHTENASIRIDASYIHDIETRRIDGRTYIMIPLNENVVEVNGIPVAGIAYK